MSPWLISLFSCRATGCSQAHSCHLYLPVLLPALSRPPVYKYTGDGRDKLSYFPPVPGQLSGQRDKCGHSSGCGVVIFQYLLTVVLLLWMSLTISACLAPGFFCRAVQLAGSGAAERGVMTQAVASSRKRVCRRVHSRDPGAGHQ